MQARQDTGDALLEQRIELPKLLREAVAGIDARDTAEGCLQFGVLADEGDGASPSRDRVERLGERHPDHRPDRIAGATRPAGLLKLSYEPPNLGRVEKSCKLGGRPVPAGLPSVRQSLRRWGKYLAILG